MEQPLRTLGMLWESPPGSAQGQPGLGFPCCSTLQHTSFRVPGTCLMQQELDHFSAPHPLLQPWNLHRLPRSQGRLKPFKEHLPQMHKSNSVNLMFTIFSIKVCPSFSCPQFEPPHLKSKMLQSVDITPPSIKLHTNSKGWGLVWISQLRGICCSCRGPS